MRLMLACCVAVAMSGCATTLPIYGHGRHYEEDDAAGDTPRRSSKFRACVVGYWLGGLAIDATLIAADLGLGEELDGVDALVVTPLVLDMFLSTAVAVPCLLGD